MPPLDTEKAQAREDLCRFLSACYYEPGREFAQERLFESMVGAAGRLDPALADQARKVAAAFEAEELQALLVDYTRLFLGPVQPVAPPYGSCWLSGETDLMQESTLHVEAMYRQAGFEIDEAFHELPDHVSVELEYLYLLTFKLNSAHRDGRTDRFDEWASLRARFLTEHLGRWVKPFAAAVRSGAETAFYRELAALTESFVLRAQWRIAPRA